MLLGLALHEHQIQYLQVLPQILTDLEDHFLCNDFLRLRIRALSFSDQ